MSPKCTGALYLRLYANQASDPDTIPFDDHVFSVGDRIYKLRQV